MKKGTPKYNLNNLFQMADEPNRYAVELTSDSFEEPFVIVDKQEEKYYSVDGIIQTFNILEDALNFAEHLNGLENSIQP